MTNETVQNAFNSITEHIKELESKIVAKDNELNELKNAAKSLEEEKQSASSKLKQMEKEMSELSSVYEELKDRADVQIDIQEVMKLYVILTEQVLNGNAHIKILTLLHGKKEEMRKEELAKASGIQPAAILRSIFDLRNNGLVTYNENNENVKLVRRLFE